MGYSRRYYLHRQLKKKGGGVLHSRTKTVFVPYNQTHNLNKYAQMLSKEFNYSIQTEIV